MKCVGHITCQTTVDERMILCGDCWRAVPRLVQDEFLRTQMRREYLFALRNPEFRAILENAKSAVAYSIEQTKKQMPLF